MFALITDIFHSVHISTCFFVQFRCNMGFCGNGQDVTDAVEVCCFLFSVLRGLCMEYFFIFILDLLSSVIEMTIITRSLS